MSGVGPKRYTDDLDDLTVDVRRTLDSLVSARWRASEGQLRDLALYREQFDSIRRRLDHVETLITLCEQVHQLVPPDPPDPPLPGTPTPPPPRADHMAWAKQRALEYLPGDVMNAMASFISDLGKHPQTQGHAAIELMGMHAAAGLLDVRTCRELIEGSN